MGKEFKGKCIGTSSTVCSTRSFFLHKRLIPFAQNFRNLIQQLKGRERDVMLFRNIIKTNGVAIGPLEYCGNGRLVKGPHGSE